MSESSGTTNGTATRPALVEKPKDTYLGARCPVCATPWSAHDSPDPKSGCFAHAPVGLFLNPPDPACIEGRRLDRAEIDKSRERYRASLAGHARPESAAVMWAVLVRVPGDASGEPADTGEVVLAKSEEEAMAMAGTRCATGRVAVRRLEAPGIVSVPLPPHAVPGPEAERLGLAAAPLRDPGRDEPERGIAPILWDCLRAWRERP